MQSLDVRPALPYKIRRSGHQARCRFRPTTELDWGHGAPLHDYGYWADVWQ